MLLIILLRLIALLTLVSGECRLGTLKVNDFNWNKVGVILLTYFQQKVCVNSSAFFLKLHFQLQ